VSIRTVCDPPPLRFFPAARRDGFNPALALAVGGREQQHTTVARRAVPETKVRLFARLGIGKSTVIDLPRDSRMLLVAEPKIANARYPLRGGGGPVSACGLTSSGRASGSNATSCFCFC